MFGFSPAAWLRVGAVLAATGALAWSHLHAYQLGRTAILQRLQSDRITVLKDGRKIDEEVLRADNAVLCALLYCCELPDDGAD